MLKDALISLGAVLILLIVAVVIGVGHARTGQLLWFLPKEEETEELIATTTTTTTETDYCCDCEQACRDGELKISKLPKAQKDILAANASVNVANYLSKELTGVNPKITIASYDQDQLWWRSREGYRLTVPNAKTMALEVTTESRNSLEKSDINKLNTHPATRNAQIKKSISLTSSYLKDLDFKRREFDRCPLNFTNDPFNNCVAYFERANITCNLIVGFGSFTNPQLDGKYRLELTCSDTYKQHHAKVTPLLDALTLINPQWWTPDLVSFNYLENGNFYRLDLGYDKADRHALFKLQDGKYMLIDGGFNAVPCQVVRTHGVPTDLSGRCV